MRTSRKLTHILTAMMALMVMSVAALAADPGAAYPATSEISDQKAGSILFYNIYTSANTGGNNNNTRINITNTNVTNAAAVHLFFVDADCRIADSYICLTQNQTASFLASDVDPGVKGYIVAVAVDRNGCPINFNYLIGDEYVKFPSGHAANLGAEAISAVAAPVCDTTSASANLIFDGGFGAAPVAPAAGLQYNRVPQVLAVSNIPSRQDGNDTMIILNRVSGNLATGAQTLSTLFGLMYDDAENVFSFSISGSCQLMNSFSNNFPRTTPRVDTIIPAGRSGWAKFYSLSNNWAILGAVINYNANAGAQANAFNGGHNLHKLTLATTSTYTIPVFPPNC